MICSRNLPVLGLVLLLLTLPAGAQTSGNLTGSISQISSSKLTFQTSGHTIDLEVNSGTLIQLDGKTVMAEDLKPGMSALVLTVDGRSASEIRATSPHAPATQTVTQSTLTGVLVQIGGHQVTLQTASHALVITLTSATVVRVDGRVGAGIGDLKTGMTAIVVAADGKTATEVRAYTPHAATTSQPASQPAGQSGIITHLADGKLSLQASVHSLEFTLTDATVYKLDGKVVGVGDFREGLRAVVFATDGKVTEIRAYTPRAATATHPGL